MNIHIQSNQIRSFAEGRLGEIAHARVYSHIHCCKECYGTYQSLVADSSDQQSPTEAILTPFTARRRLSELLPGLYRPRLRYVILNALVLLLVVGVWWGRPLGDGTQAAHDPDILIRAMTAASRNSDIVFPGADVAVISDDRPGSEAPGAHQVAGCLEYFSARLTRGHNRPKDLFLLAGGYLAVNHTDDARDVLRCCPSGSATDSQLLHMEALVAFRDDRLDDARALLQSSLDIKDDAVARLNLGVVYRALGDVENAQICFQRASQMSGDSALGQRARKLSSQLTY